MNKCRITYPNKKEVWEYKSRTTKILKTKKELYTIISKHSGQSIKKVEEDGDRDFWLTAQEAKDYGMIDEILMRNEK